MVAETCLLYRNAKRMHYWWRGRMFAADPILGFAPVPNSRGAEICPVGEIPVRSDGEGFRIPAGDTDVAALGPPRAIALGCSFTYGSLCLAEETYPYNLSKELDINCVNAGVVSYGLSQILIRARSLIPRHKPDYVIVQYSPWLVERSQGYYALGFYVKVPVPYFAESEFDDIYIHYPIFRSKVHELPISGYRGTPKSIADFSSFLFNVGLPLYHHDHLNILIHKIKLVAGVTPRPIADGQRIVDYVYGEIGKLCEENRAKMIVVVLGDSVNTKNRHVLDRIPNALVVDAHTALIERLPEPSEEAYTKAYCHWRGNPPVLVDGHPNARAHRIIALELAKTIRRIRDRPLAQPDRVSADATSD